MNSKGGYVYIMANYDRTVLYIGVTSNLHSRVYDHREGNGSLFTKKYKCKYLVFYEFIEDIESAILREKQMKKWKREWKINLITSMNPGMEDLSNKVFDMQ